VLGLGAAWDFVCFSITIIVFEIADFFFWFARYTDQDAIGTRAQSVAAFAQGFGGGACFSTTGIAFIYKTIAIIIEFVAAFWAWAFPDACESSGLALVGALLAFAFFAAIGATTTTAGVAFVDGTIAVIVFAVASFGLCGTASTQNRAT
jgi:hypothetical protein